MKMKKIISLLIAPLLVFVLATGCLNDEDAIQFSLTDVSSRITGFSSEITGAGASLTISGSQMDQVQRVFMEDFVIPKKSFTSVTEAGITFNVPLSVPLGENEVLIVFPGSERAFSSIEVVPLQAISTFVPASAASGETVTLFGTNFEIVEGVKLGGIDATITSQSESMIKFTVPTGVATGKITLVSDAGTANSATDLIACSANPTTSDCPQGLNQNAGLELGSGDNFDNWSKWNGGGFLLATTNPSEVYRGARALKVVRDGSLGSGQWRIQFASDPVATEVGASYSVYIWARAAATGGSFRVSTNPNALYTGDQNVNITWTRHKFDFTANETSTRIVLDLNGNNTAVTTFFIDDVKLIKN